MIPKIKSISPEIRAEDSAATLRSLRNNLTFSKYSYSLAGESKKSSKLVLIIPRRV